MNIRNIVLGIIISVANLNFGFPLTVAAEGDYTSVTGEVVVMSNKNNNFPYEDEKSATTDNANTYGTFLLSGSLNKTSPVNGVDAYDVQETVNNSGVVFPEISFLYKYDDTKLNTDENKNWKIYDDDSKRIGDIELEEKVKSGAIVIQSSFDHENWSTDLIQTDVFKTYPTNNGNDNEAIYTTKYNQIVNGCYFKIVIAYQTRKKAGKKIVINQYDYQEHVEVYEFYLCDKTANALAADPAATPKYTLSSDPVNTGVDNSYSGSKIIQSTDIARGCKVGKFYINGFSGNPHYYSGDEVSKKNPVFLKNVGDKVTLWFQLDQKNINALEGNKHLSITADDKGGDEALSIQKQKFGRGALIIKYTDYENNPHYNVYKDYLAAASTTSADTKVQLFEEGDYEVALDYIIKDSSPLAWKIPKPSKNYAYRISFKFSIRNSNCMVYPIDLKTGAELTVPYTENGFKLDLAKSRYLDLSIRKKVLTLDGLDLRSSQVSNDLEEYTDEGIYEFTVKNKITDDKVTKAIYVGTNNLLKAYVKYGKDYGGTYSIADLKNMRDSGYEFMKDGTITAPHKQQQNQLDQSQKAVENETENNSSVGTDSTLVSTTNSTQNHSSENINTDNADIENIEKESPNGFAILLALIIAFVIFITIVRKRRKRRSTDMDNRSNFL